MAPILDEDTECKRCGYELNAKRDTCPRCQFSPRARGLRVALIFLLGVVVSMTVAMFVPSLGRVLLGLAALSFLLTLLTFFVSFVVTPYRFGNFFLRL